MSDLETRVARAMYDAWVLRSGSATKWDDLAQEERDNFADDARAAIAAAGVEELRVEVERLREALTLARPWVAAWTPATPDPGTRGDAEIALVKIDAALVEGERK